MNNNTMSDPLHRALETVCRELIDGAESTAAWVLNGGDAGLLRSLDRLPASAVSARSPQGGASIAAHVEHVRFGLSLMNRWANGEPDPWSTANWAASWDRTVVNDQEWAELREGLAAEAHAWLQAIRIPRDYSEMELKGVIASVAHLGYHLGAMRQIDRSIRGPAEASSA